VSVFRGGPGDIQVECGLTRIFSLANGIVDVLKWPEG
jgi:hypothetical protein